jgi:hypothetical protein
MNRDQDGKYFWQGKAEKFFEWWHGLTTTPGAAVAWTGSIWLILSFASVMMLYREDTIIALVTTDASDQVPEDESDEYWTAFASKTVRPSNCPSAPLKRCTDK